MCAWGREGTPLELSANGRRCFVKLRAVSTLSLSLSKKLFRSAHTLQRQRYKAIIRLEARCVLLYRNAEKRQILMHKTLYILVYYYCYYYVFGTNYMRSIKIQNAGGEKFRGASGARFFVTHAPVREQLYIRFSYYRYYIIIYRYRRYILVHA